MAECKKNLCNLNSPLKYLCFTFFKVTKSVALNSQYIGNNFNFGEAIIKHYNLLLITNSYQLFFYHLKVNKNYFNKKFLNFKFTFYLGPQISLQFRPSKVNPENMQNRNSLFCLFLITENH